MTGETETPGPRRQTLAKIVASLLLAAAAVVLWASSLLPWARVEAEDGLSPMRSFTVKGSDWSPWLTPVALALLASIAVVWSLRGWALRVLAILLALGAVVIAIPAISLITSPPSSDYAARAIDLSSRFRILLTTTNPWIPVVILVAAALVAVAAVVALRAARGAGMSSRYQSPAARREELERKVFAEHERRKRAEAAGERADGNERTLWDSLDGGVDPTE